LGCVTQAQAALAGTAKTRVHSAPLLLTEPATHSCL
jgi:hypothetical protein